MKESQGILVSKLFWPRRRSKQLLTIFISTDMLKRAALKSTGVKCLFSMNEIHIGVREPQNFVITVPLMASIGFLLGNTGYDQMLLEQNIFHRGIRYLQLWFFYSGELIWECSRIKVEIEVPISAKICTHVPQTLFRRILNYLTIFLSSAQDQGLMGQNFLLLMSWQNF